MQKNSSYAANGNGYVFYIIQDAGRYKPVTGCRHTLTGGKKGRLNKAASFVYQVFFRIYQFQPFCTSALGL
jgi:hypothetical protein